MDSRNILEALQAKGINFSIVAEAIGVSTNMVSSVASRKATSRRVAKAISKAIDLPIEQVFPDKPDYHSPVPRQTKVAALKKDLSAA